MTVWIKTYTHGTQCQTYLSFKNNNAECMSLECSIKIKIYHQPSFPHEAQVGVVYYFFLLENLISKVRTKFLLRKVEALSSHRLNTTKSPTQAKKKLYQHNNDLDPIISVSYKGHFKVIVTRHCIWPIFFKVVISLCYKQNGWDVWSVTQFLYARFCKF